MLEEQERESRRQAELQTQMAQVPPGALPLTLMLMSDDIPSATDAISAPGPGSRKDGGR